MPQIRVDLHTHSQASPDGSLSPTDYSRMLGSGRLQSIAITDHDRIDFAQHLRDTLGNAIIIGEEISALEGELIGLYLHDPVPPGLSAADTMNRIHAQGGLVYVPHPFETRRKGLSDSVLKKIADQVDIIETHNGRTLQDRSLVAVNWAVEHGIPQACSSDAHGRLGWGNTASILAELPTRESIITLLRTSRQSRRSTGAIGRAYPKLNHLRKWSSHV